VKKKLTLQYNNNEMASKTREKLIEVARQLFARKGVAHTTMNDIASASSKGRRTIYTYFKSKKDIYNAVLEQESERLVDTLREVVARDASVEERLCLFIHNSLDRYISPSSLTSFKTWISFDSRRLNKIRALAREKENEMLRSLLAEGREKGVFDSQRCNLLAGFMSALMSAVDSHAVDTDVQLEREKALDYFVEFIMLGIKPQPSNTLDK